VPELRFLAAIASAARDALFFTGDLGQRIFQQPFSWRALGVDVHGRNETLNVNYRTSHQIRETADRLIPGPVSDADGETDGRAGAVSVFNGPEPLVVLADDGEAERRAVAEFIRAAIADGVAPEEIALFVRTREIMGRARETVKAAGCTPFELTLHKEGSPGEVRIGVMHLAKGLEFKAVALVGCDEDQLPLRSRIEAAAERGRARRSSRNRAAPVLRGLHPRSRSLAGERGAPRLGVSGRPQRTIGDYRNWRTHPGQVHRASEAALLHAVNDPHGGNLDDVVAVGFEAVRLGVGNNKGGRQRLGRSRVRLLPPWFPSAGLAPRASTRQQPSQ
jgi:hypothetical protein